MDIDKVRGLSDAELEIALRDAKQELWQARFDAVHPAAQGLQHDPADPSDDRADPDGPAERRVGRAPGADRGDHAMTGASTVQRQAEDQGRPRRQRQDGQDDRRVRRAPGTPPAVQAGHPLDAPSSRPTTRPTRPASATPCSSRRAARCRRRSAGASSRSRPRPAITAARRTSSSRRPRPPRRSTRPPIRGVTAPPKRRRRPEPPRRPGPTRDPAPDPPQGRRQHRRPDHPVHPGDGPLAEDRWPASAT